MTILKCIEQPVLLATGAQAFQSRCVETYSYCETYIHIALSFGMCNSALCYAL